MKKNRFHLLVESVCRFIFLFCSMGALLFLSAGTLQFASGWIAICILFAPALISGLFFFFRNPEMLNKRVRHREQDPRQQKLVFLCAVVFASGLVAAGLSFRFSFLCLPVFCLPIGAVSFISSMIVYCLAYSANPFLSKAVLVQDKQFVVDTGIYGKIRHPYYLATCLLYFAISLALNSVISFCVFRLFIPLLFRRISYEEEYLKKELPGYAEYLIKVPYRIIHGVW